MSLIVPHQITCVVHIIIMCVHVDLNLIITLSFKPQYHVLNVFRYYNNDHAVRLFAITCTCIILCALECACVQNVHVCGVSILSVWSLYTKCARVYVYKKKHFK